MLITKLSQWSPAPSCLLTKNVLQKAHDLVTQTYKQQNKNKIELRSVFLTLQDTVDTCQALEKVISYVCCLKLSIFKKMLDELQRMTINVLSYLIHIRRIDASKERSY